MTDLTAKALSDSRSFENAILEREQRMKKAGWMVAGVAGFLLTGAIAALIILLPLKKTMVELYTLDRQTGRIERVTTVGEDELDASEVLNLSQTAAYVKRREGYNYFALQKDYNETQMFNSDAVNKEYLDWFNSPDAPDALFQQAAHVVTVDVLSNVPSAGTKPDNVEMLRIKRTIRRVKDNSETHDYWTIRMTYRYVPQQKMTASEREVNPFGFMVTSYQRFKEKIDE
ncbi:type IV secretion system protein [Enterobacter kobei]|uniref:virB8 family protein n=1 Tax=Enterobacter kobei TaxID=208224 RepID=UPI00300C973A